METKHAGRNPKLKLKTALTVTGVALGAASASLLAARVQLPQWLQVTAVVIAVTYAIAKAMRKALRRAARDRSHDDGGDST